MKQELFGEIKLASQGMGRRPSFDIRDMKFPMKAILPTKPSTLTQKTWADDVWWGDQKSTPMCVGFSWAHWLSDGPVKHKGVIPTLVPEMIYNEARKIDEWPGDDYEGTSVRAGAKYLKTKGLIASYHWAYQLNDLVQALLTLGPVEMGTNWYAGMMDPDAKGLIKITGEAVGGHAFVFNGVNTKTKTIRIKNSWGRAWGIKGHAFIGFKDVERLLSEQGEACLATEIPT